MRLIRQNIVFFLALLLFSGLKVVYAGDSSNTIGTTGAQFLELPVGARAIAMGSAGGAISHDATAIYYNPAGLAGIKETDISLMQAFYFQNISYQFGGIAGKLGDDDNVYALGVQHLSPGTIAEVDNTGNPTGGSLNPGDWAVAAGFGKQFGILDIGIAGKYISSKIDKSASAVAVDAGLRLNISENIILAGSLSNMGTKLKYRESEDSLPVLGRIGSAVKFKDILLAADLLMPKGVKMYFAAGTEFCAYQAENLRFLLRAGYNGRTSSSKLGGLTGFSAGTGFDINRFSVDYAFTPFGNLGNSHRISLSMKFGGDDTYGYDSYARNQKIKPAKNNDDVSSIYFTQGSEAVVNVDKTKLYRYSDDESSVLVVLKKGAELEVEEQRSNWVKVNTVLGKTGWLHKSALRKSQ